MLRQTGLVGDHVLQGDWDKATSLRYSLPLDLYNYRNFSHLQGYINEMLNIYIFAWPYVYV